LARKLWLAITVQESDPRYFWKRVPQTDISLRSTTMRKMKIDRIHQHTEAVGLAICLLFSRTSVRSASNLNRLVQATGRISEQADRILLEK
jgi:hypothetical protein